MKLFAQFRLAAIVLSVVVGASSCGVGAQSSSTKATPLPPSTGPAVSFAPGSSSSPPGPSPSEPRPTPQPPANNNTLGSPLSRLCWARTEALIAVVTSLAALGYPDKAVDRDPASLLVPRLRLVQAELEKGGDETLPPTLRAQWNRLLREILTVEKQWEGGGRKPLDVAFDFANYPGSKDYDALYPKDPGCVDPA